VSSVAAMLIRTLKYRTYDQQVKPGPALDGAGHRRGPVVVEMSEGTDSFPVMSDLGFLDPNRRRSDTIGNRWTSSSKIDGRLGTAGQEDEKRRERDGPELGTAVGAVACEVDRDRPHRVAEVGQAAVPACVKIFKAGWSEILCGLWFALVGWLVDPGVKGVSIASRL
jgi:hypothetical protein